MAVVLDELRENGLIEKWVRVRLFMRRAALRDRYGMIKHGKLALRAAAGKGTGAALRSARAGEG